MRFGGLSFSTSIESLQVYVHSFTLVAQQSTRILTESHHTCNEAKLSSHSPYPQAIRQELLYVSNAAFFFACWLRDSCVERRCCCSPATRIALDVKRVSQQLKLCHRYRMCNRLYSLRHFEQKLFQMEVLVRCRTSGLNFGQQFTILVTIGLNRVPQELPVQSKVSASILPGFLAFLS